MAEVLLIEPDRLRARNVSQALMLQGYNVSSKQTGQGAVHAAELKTPDIIVMELQLANHNGLEFLYEFRSYPEWQSIPVILYTLVPPTILSNNKEIFDRLGVEGYLYKPLSKLRHIVTAVERLVPVKV